MNIKTFEKKMVQVATIIGVDCVYPEIMAHGFTQKDMEIFEVNGWSVHTLTPEDGTRPFTYAKKRFKNLRVTLYT